MSDYHRRGGKRDPRNRVYRSARWRNYTRPTTLDRDDHTCRRCGAHANSVHHGPEHTLIELIALGLDPFDPDHCESLCASCHGYEDATRAQSKPPRPNRFIGSAAIPD